MVRRHIRTERVRPRSKGRGPYGGALGIVDEADQRADRLELQGEDGNRSRRQAERAVAKRRMPDGTDLFVVHE